MSIAEDLDLASSLIENIKDKKVTQVFELLCNIIEKLSSENQQLREENQDLKDENNRLKKELGKPDIKPNNRGKCKKKTSRNYSSEKERNNCNQNERKRGSKKDKIVISETTVCDCDKSILPSDAVFKSYNDVMVQELQFTTHNHLFRKKVYYSESTKTTYTAPLPLGFCGEFGPQLKSFVILLKHVANMSEPKIHELLKEANFYISAGTISNILTKNNEGFHEEKADIVTAGNSSSEYTQTDDTKARVNGSNYHTHILSNKLFSAFFTEEKKNRRTVLQVLMNGLELTYTINDLTIKIAEKLNIGKKDLLDLVSLKSEKIYSEGEFNSLLEIHLPKVKDRIKHKILDASAISAYRNRTDIPIINLLICDDAPQFKQLTEYLSLCWVHEGRHYKKLSPIVPSNANKLKIFLTDFWSYYHKLVKYKENHTSEMQEILDNEFDCLFSRHTGYQELDNRIEKTFKKKENLLMVLKYPNIPLHNNDAELAARIQVRKRDVSLHTMSAEGTRSMDTFMTISATAKKLGINIYKYFFDRISGKYSMPSLASLIMNKALQN